MPLHDKRFPNESSEYRTARDALLVAERELKLQIERVAAQRRTLPPGGAIREDYVFDEESGGAIRKVKLSELFGQKSTLIAYNYMFPGHGDPSKPCPMCTSMLDALNGQAKDVTQQVSLAVIAKMPIDRVMAFARDRGWRNLRLLSSAHNTYNADYHGETEKGEQLPMMNVFTRRDGKIFHSWASELFFAPGDAGMGARHVDIIWPLWNLLDLTPEGRGTTWLPKLAY
jgi:predicted dithiol-disulfide oxidoreductase (DUF899 family)